MHPYVQVVDRWLIWGYRLTGLAVLDFIIGTVLLAGLCLILGKLTAGFVLRFLQPRLAQYGDEAAKYQELALTALKTGDKEAYQAANKLANDAFGHTFFQQVALSAAYLWPIFFALAWMQYRFLELAVPIPGTPWSLGFIGVFLLLYFGTLIVVKSVARFVRRFIWPPQVPVSPGTVPNSPTVP